MHDFSYNICPGCLESLPWVWDEEGQKAIPYNHRKPAPIYVGPDYKWYYCQDS